MKQYMTLPIGELVSDVPVDPVHSRELADSIMSKGQLAPAIIREETREVIDGFHRIAAMKELGFNQVECVLTPCDDEGFWDFRIIQASLHKNVTFARAVDWIDKLFQLSPWTNKYRSAYTLFSSVRKEEASPDAKQWVESKAKIWGLSVRTIENWLYTKQSLTPELLEEVKSFGEGREELPTDTYIRVAQGLPTKPELQKKVIAKAKSEQLSPSQAEILSKALRQAEDEEEVQSILRQPVSRTEDQMVRDAKVEKLFAHPREITPLEKYQEAKKEDVLYKLDQLAYINSCKAMTPEKISALTPEQKADVYRTCEEVITETKRVMGMLRPTIRAEYQLREG